MLEKVKKNNKGFTLVELIVVIAILGVLAMLIVPRIMENVDAASRNRDISNARTLASEINVWNAKQPTAATRIIDKAPVDHIIVLDEYDDRLTLPTDITWPLATNATITIDANGNAAVDIIPIP